MKEPCRCECGYKCGGPGACSLPLMECISKTDGEHYVKDCDHDFTGESVEISGGWSKTCKNCGMSAFAHDMRNAP